MKIDEFFGSSNINRMKGEYQREQDLKELKRQQEREAARRRYLEEKRQQLPLVKAFVEQVLLPMAKYDGSLVKLPSLHFHEGGSFSHILNGRYGGDISPYFRVYKNHLNDYLREAVPGIQIDEKSNETICGPDYVTTYDCSYSIDLTKVQEQSQQQGRGLR